MTPEELQRERRDAEIERAGGRKLTGAFACKVVGVSFVDHYPDNLWALDQADTDAKQAGETLAAILRRNPDNAYDANAIEVHVPALGDWGMIGHLTRPIAARLAPEMDAGTQWHAEVESVLIDPSHMDRPGISVRCARITEEDQAS